MLGDHWLYFKALAYPQSANVPLIFNWPGHLKPGKVVNGIMQEIDVFPTITELAGIENPPGVQGKSQSRVLTTDSNDTGYEYAYIEHPDADYSLRSLKWRFSYYPGKDYGELYDLEKDPHEFTNLWNDENTEDLKARLTNKLLDRIVQTRDPLPVRKKPY